MKYFKQYLYFFRLIFFLLLVFFNACDDDKKTLPQKEPAPQLTYTKQTLTFSTLSDNDADKKSIISNKILAGVSGEKKGYTIKNISIVRKIPSNFSASVKNNVIVLNSLGTVVFDLALEHPSKKDATVKNCSIEIIKSTAERLTFQKVSKSFISGGKFTTAEILGGVRGNKTGYTVKNITTLNPSNLATVTPAKELNFSGRIGSFTATLILEHPTKADVTIANCTFEITKTIAENLTFQKVSKSFISGGKFTTAEILGGVRGNKTGYTVKNITTLNPSNLATVSASKELNFSGGIGSFTATLILEHPTKTDVSIPNCTFEITKTIAENLTFQKVSKSFISGGKFTTAEILAGVRGSKTGYTIKNITTLSSDIVKITSSKALDFKNLAGSFTATIVLQHNTKADVTIANCAFEITKLTAESLTFNKITKPFASGGKFTTADILAGVRGSKTGYTVKNITTLNPSNLATVTPAKELNFSGSAGSFKATLILEHPTKADVTIVNCAFEIRADASPTLTFQKVSKSFSSGGKFTTTDILAGVRGNKTDYTVKNITTLNPSNLVTVSASKELNFGGSAGSFTATLILEHPTKADVTIANCAFEIRADASPTLTFQKVSKSFSSGGKFSTAEILAGVQGSKTDYTVKNITTLNPSNLVTVSASKELNFGGSAGSFTATIILEHPTKADVTIANCAFEITKLSAPTLTFSKLTKQLVSGGRFSSTEILAGVQGSKTDYTVKEIKGIFPVYVAKVSGVHITMSYVGRFTATLILEHPTKSDVTLTNCAFEITKAIAEKLDFQKVSKPFSSGGSFNIFDILKGVTGNKNGYFLKRVENLVPSNLATIYSSDPSAGILSVWRIDFSGGRLGSFTATIILEHPTKAEVTIENCVFEITRGSSETLTFQKVSKAFSSGGKFTTAEILAGVRGSKTGYTIKNITTLNPNNLATVSASKELNFSGGVGRFTATLILAHPTKADATIAKCWFEISKSTPESLTFTELKKKFSTGGGSFTTAEILGAVVGTKNDYEIKSIRNLNPNNLAIVAGVAPNLTINFSNSGAFTAEIILQHPTKSDVTISNAAFYMPTTWDKTFGGTDTEEINDITKTNDEGFVVVGYTEDATKGAGDKDFWVMKINKFGSLVWEKTYGGSKKDIAYAVIENTDGDYVVAGETKSYKATGGRYSEFWVMKLNKADGTQVWAYPFGKKSVDIAYDVIQTNDGGYAVVGSSRDGTTKENFWILKLTSDGTKTWEATYGGKAEDFAHSIVQNSDGTYVVAGKTKSSGIDISSSIDIFNNGKEDIWVMKITADGQTQRWAKTFGGNENDNALAIIKTTDGGYAISGETMSKGSGQHDFWILKINSAGTKTWEKTFGGVQYDRNPSMIQTADGGYAVVGNTNSGRANFDAWLLKLNSSGNKTWEKFFTGNKSERIYGIVQTKYGGYTLAGATNTKGNGNYDGWVLKVDKNGDL